jgi:quercetin dioxygenase-like cupin family protein
MKKIVTIGIAAITIVSCQTARNFNTGDIFPKGQKVSNDNFTGNVWLNMLVQGDTVYNTSVGSVTFEPGARTKWHYHPGGQILLVTNGTGWYQEKGKPIEIIKKGDVIKCPANVEHWHGASKDSYFVQVAVTDNKNGSVVWLQPVTEEEYHK